MRRTWTFVAGVIVLGVLAGVAIAGRPVANDGFTVSAASQSTTSSTVAPVDASTTTRAVVATSAPGTSAPTTPAPTPAPTTAAPTTTTVPIRDRAEVRVVVANGSAQGGLASDVAALLRVVGYDTVVAANATSTVQTSTVYYRPDFESEARRLVDDMGFANVAVEPLPDAAVSLRDGQGDVVAVLGVDARQ